MVVLLRDQGMKLLVKMYGWKVFVRAWGAVSVIFALAILSYPEDRGVIFIPSVLLGILYYCWMYGTAECFEERDRTFSGTAVKVAIVGTALGFLSIWILPYLMVNGISRQALPQSVWAVVSLLRLASYLLALYASYTLTQARLQAEGRPPQKTGFLSVIPGALALTFLPIFAWILFQAQFRKLFVARQT